MLPEHVILFLRAIMYDLYHLIFLFSSVAMSYNQALTEAAFTLLAQVAGADSSTITIPESAELDGRMRNGHMTITVYNVCNS